MVQLEKDEFIIKEVRKHWFFIALKALWSIFMATFPGVALVLLFTIGNFPELVTLKIYLIVLSPLWLLIMWIEFFYFWTDYYLDVLVITNRRILDIEQQGLFTREISTFPLENIQDITIKTDGILATLFKFGTVDVQTAGENQGFTIENAADPELVKQIISDAHDKVIPKKI